MKIHYNEEFDSYEVTECSNTDEIMLDDYELKPVVKATWLSVLKHSIDGEHPSYDSLKCSNCGSHAVLRNGTKFCPNCGAMMSKEIL